MPYDAPHEFTLPVILSIKTEIINFTLLWQRTKRKL